MDQVSFTLDRKDAWRVYKLLETLSYEQIDQLSGCYPTAEFVDSVLAAMYAMREVGGR